MEAQVSSWFGVCGIVAAGVLGILQRRVSQRHSRQLFAMRLRQERAERREARCTEALEAAEVERQKLRNDLDRHEEKDRVELAARIEQQQRQIDELIRSRRPRPR